MLFLEHGGGKRGKTTMTTVRLDKLAYAQRSDKRVNNRGILNRRPPTRGYDTHIKIRTYRIIYRRRNVFKSPEQIIAYGNGFARIKGHGRPGDGFED